jgi:hypothetical protein
MRACTLAAQPSGMSLNTPPTRTYEWVSRAPEISSSSVYSHSRAFSR